MQTLTCFRPALLIGLFACSTSMLFAAPEEEAAAIPGLVATYESLPVAEATTPAGLITRIDPTPCLFGGATEMPDFRLPLGGVRVRWNSQLLVQYSGDYVFTSRRNTLEKFAITLGGKAVSLGRPIELESGFLELTIVAEQSKGPFALDLWWRGPGFADEPIDPRFFSHHDTEANLKRDMLAEDLAVERGAILARTLGCGRCHSDDSMDTHADLVASLPGPRLDKVAERQWPDALLAYHSRKHPLEANGIPVGEEVDARDFRRVIAAYLATKGTPAERASGSVDRGKVLYEQFACAACHRLDDLNDPATGDRRTYTSSVPSLSFPIGWRLKGLADFLRDPLESRPHGRMPKFPLSEAESLDLAAFLTGNRTESRVVSTLNDEEMNTAWQKTVDPGQPLPGASYDQRVENVALRAMAKRQCFNCHELDAGNHVKIERRASGLTASFSDGAKPARVEVTSRPLREIGVQHAARGCLSATDERTPRFALHDRERSDLVSFVQQMADGISPSATSRLNLDLAVMNCVRCHENGGQGGEGLKAVVGESPEAKYYLPPSLTRVGERVRAERLSDWIANGPGEKALRPWVKARMPAFGPHGARIAQALIERDGVTGPVPVAQGESAPSIPVPDVQPSHARLGQFLVGAKALACINCHTLHGNRLAGQSDPTTRGPDLDSIAAHLRPEYFYRWTMNPARIRPGTKMPQTIQANGTVPLAQLAGLPPGTPMSALWSYLSQGSKAPPPVDEATVVSKPLPDQPLVQRGDTDAGDGLRPTRGVSLGFADGTLLFDADQLQFVNSWFGGFVRSTDQNYFGLYWHKEGEETPDRTWFLPRSLKVKRPGNNAWQDFELPLESDANEGTRFEGYQIGKTSIRLRYRLAVGEARVKVTEDVRVEARLPWQGFARSLSFVGLPPGAEVAIELPATGDLRYFDTGGKGVTEASDLKKTPLAGYRAMDRPHVTYASGTAGTRWESAGSNRRIVSAAAPANEPLRLRVDCWRTHNGFGDQLPPEVLADFVTNSPKLTNDFDLDIAPAIPVAAYESLAENNSSEKPAGPLRAALKYQENIDEFAPVKTRIVRFNILATDNKSGAGIDELEVYGPASGDNLALKGTASASSVISGYPIHQIRHLNDGKLGNSNSWVANDSTGWVQIEWPEPVEIAKLVWARDRTGTCRDRLAVDYRVDVSNNGTDWASVCDSSDRQPAAGANGAIRPNASPGYVMQAIPAPFPGCRPSDIAFDATGVMYAIAMTEGQVWRTKMPPANQPSLVRWQRFASGLNHPIGLQIVDGHVYVAQKPEITELIDRDGDGVADHFRTIAGGWGLSQGWHEYTFGLAVDRDRNLWFALNTGYFWTNPGYVNPGRYRGSVMRIDYGSEKLVQVAKGCRVPNGIASGPGGGIFYTDNQGDWIQSCKIAHVVPGRFYGHPEYKEDALPKDQYPDGRSAIWMPYNLSRSSSGPVHDTTGGKFGPFADQMFLGDVGYGANPGVMRIALEQVDGEWQGACFRFIDDQPHGCVRMKFGPDGRLYLASLTTGLTRVHFSGPEPLAIQAMKIRPRGEGFVLQLTRPLATDTKLEPAQFRFRRYHYLYTGNYGSPEADSQNVAVSAVELSPDRKSITLSLPVETHPIGMVYEMNAGKLVDEDGQLLKHNEAWYTVQRIPQ